MPTANTWPPIAAGDDLTADLLSEMLPRIIVKPAATTITSSTSLTADPDLTMALEANATYFVEFYIRYTAINAEKFKTTWTVPSGAGGNRAVIGPGSSANDTNLDNSEGRFGAHAYGTAVGYGTRNSATNQCSVIETAVLITGSSAGSVTLNWGQSTSGSTGTTVDAASLMRVTRIG